ncbi:MAG: biopolymer transporter ExbD [Candidatus Eremiobacteraeota bacterium]|nr:biopolymer transporter ExbD [Candidatus Eremiobacteraeota bacterium]
MAMGGGESEEDTMSSINITPLTDCIMVLLIIFMIASTAMSQTGFNIQLPRVSTKEEAPPSQIVLSVSKAGDYFVGANKVATNNLEAYLKKLAATKHTNRIIINGDSDVPYGKVISAMDCAKKSGLTSIALATKLKGE